MSEQTVMSHKKNMDVQEHKRLQHLDEEWDLIVVGGGITGAGVLREASRCGLKALLLEQKDYAWGTSSRSSKMVHGGLRYIPQGQLKLTHESVIERERLMKEAPGLVDLGSFTMPHYKWKFPGPFSFNALLAMYDFYARLWAHYFSNKTAVVQKLIPGLKHKNLVGATMFRDAFVDDARLVMRVLDEAFADGGTAMNYSKVVDLLKDGEQVCGVCAEDGITGETVEFKAKVVVSAAGVWSDPLRAKVGEKPVIRPLRGSHLVIPSWRLPVAHACCFMHPDDKRPVFVFPWEGSTVVGTTDLDNIGDLDDEPAITNQEIEYLLKAVNGEFDSAAITHEDVISTWTGVRPVISSGKNIDPSKETRDHAVWDKNGLVSVCGGKLTTFRLIARDVLTKANHYLPDVTVPADKEDATIFHTERESVEDKRFMALGKQQQKRLQGRFGIRLHEILQRAEDSDFLRIGSTDFLWLELRWAAQTEQVEHLDDLLLRRTRVGNLIKGGATEHMDRIGQIMTEDGGWTGSKWQEELERYSALWKRAYSPENPA